MTIDLKIKFLTLKIFAATGGIEKVNRIIGKCLQEYADEGKLDFEIYSLHDNKKHAKGNLYFDDKIFFAFNGNLWRFIIFCLRGIRSDIIILSHFNLLVVGFVIKILNPSCKLILVAHGIEVWERKNLLKRMMLSTCDKIVAVSNFTKEQIVANNNIKKDNVLILNNALDPFLKKDEVVNKEVLLKRYHLDRDDILMFALTRFSFQEQYKGYDQVIKAMSYLQKEFPKLKYILAGKYDLAEYNRINNLAKSWNLEKKVIFTGFIPDAELGDHFRMCDIFVMPSEREGFGIVFIEALFYDLPVLAGNIDGSVDALKGGELGILVDPKNLDEIKEGIIRLINMPVKVNHEVLMENFSFSVYKSKLYDMLQRLTSKTEEHV